MTKWASKHRTGVINNQRYTEITVLTHEPLTKYITFKRGGSLYSCTPRPNPRKTWCMGPYAGVNYNLTLSPMQSGTLD
jgi:hypothetical protein